MSDDFRLAEIFEALTTLDGKWDDVKEAIGEVGLESFKAQYGVEHPSWPPLKASTRHQRVQQGYSPNQPLLRSGMLKDTVTYETGEKNVTIGIPTGVMITHPYDSRPVEAGKLATWMETGTLHTQKSEHQDNQCIPI